MEKNMIGKYLRDLRRRRGMSQQELALALGVSKQTISNWEVGRKVPRMKTVEKIANIFGVSRNSILAGLPVEMLEQEGQEDRRVVDLTDLDIRLTYMGQQVPREYIDIIEKLMRCDIAERDAQ
ncbi:helix-turn-helix domain-containing protein [Lactobacillus delbrueckii]|jgi:transcriptional regulator with XRE-family HTH domain|uniref:helix-turn-helix domain-containing protein n=1 Tax=Lactobacillus delbrueckii TaxID=1584 RepID=UPI000680C595|nr:helix-turn-helix transcriptional regulator [Lactobacillus delbrueckii]APG75329.1 transcriptional regulator [Lactobacillus delbrueckii subsp. sunkii]ARR37387.1 transcriptional regulator [Lactobacillus delbrueckii subsp. delbrueckii]KNE73657.1 XRE family transcriptional regulator [Lactobacillus delbrueckii subsp. sunkii]MCT2877402.1 XRE family transcriptional regulator [Lactobacillus delbrueckii]MDK8261459.1 helix-turn-helix transcriptional regulator [Lactobacillus delbrueckii]